MARARTDIAEDHEEENGYYGEVSCPAQCVAAICLAMKSKCVRGGAALCRLIPCESRNYNLLYTF